MSVGKTVTKVHSSESDFWPLQILKECIAYDTRDCSWAGDRVSIRLTGDKIKQEKKLSSGSESSVPGRTYLETEWPTLSSHTIKPITIFAVNYTPDIVTHLLKTLLGNGPVNTFQYTRHTTIRWKCFLFVRSRTVAIQHARAVTSHNSG
jgi:hypothetical protein